MTEPPRPGDATPDPPADPTAPSPPPSSGAAPQYGPAPGEYGTPPGGYGPPPGGYAPPPGDFGPPPGGYAPPPGGYGTPPGGYAPPPGGYGGPPGGYGTPGAAPAGYPTPDDRTWALIAHFGGAFGALVSWGTFGWVAPLIALLAKGNESPTIRAHAAAALNFQALWAIISVVSLALATCLFWLVVPALLFAVPLIPIILGLVGGARANDGQLYRYPLSIPMVK